MAKKSAQRYTRNQKTFLKNCVLPKYGDKTGMKKLTRIFNQKFGTKRKPVGIYNKAAILQGRWVLGNGRRKKSDIRTRCNYTPEQKKILQTWKLPGSSLRSKKSWGRKMNKLLGTNCTWAALLHQAKSLKGDWQSGGGVKKKVSKSKDTRIRVGTKSASVMKKQKMEYGLMVNGEIVWNGDVEPEIFRGKRSGKIIVRIKGEKTQTYSPGVDVEVIEKDLD